MLLHRQKKFAMCVHARAHHCRFAREASGHGAPWLLPACPMPSLAPRHVSSLHESRSNDSSTQVTLSCCLITCPPHRRLSAATLAPAPPPAPHTRPCALPSSRRASRRRSSTIPPGSRPAAGCPCPPPLLPCCPRLPQRRNAQQRCAAACATSKPCSRSATGQLPCSLR